MILKLFLTLSLLAQFENFVIKSEVTRPQTVKSEADESGERENETNIDESIKNLNSRQSTTDPDSEFIVTSKKEEGIKKKRQAPPEENDGDANPENPEQPNPENPENPNSGNPEMPNEQPNPGMPQTTPENKEWFSNTNNGPTQFPPVTAPPITMPNQPNFQPTQFPPNFQPTHQPPNFATSPPNYPNGNPQRQSNPPINFATNPPRPVYANNGQNPVFTTQRYSTRNQLKFPTTLRRNQPQRTAGRINFQTTPNGGNFRQTARNNNFNNQATTKQKLQFGTTKRVAGNLVMGTTSTGFKFGVTNSRNSQQNQNGRLNFPSG